MQGRSRAERLLPIADDELVLGWRNSEWTGIAPFLEEDVAFSSLAQAEIGHARALYELVAEELGTDADALAYDRRPDEYRCAALAQLRLVPDWARTVARHVLYEAADEVRLATLRADADPAVRGIAEKIDREEAYHRLHAEMWGERLAGEARYREALEELWPYAVAMLAEEERPALADRIGLELPGNSLLQSLGRDAHLEEWAALWDEMTQVRRLAPAAQW